MAQPRRRDSDPARFVIGQRLFYMAIERRIRTTARDRNGSHAFFMNDGQWWSPRPRFGVIRDIERGAYRYYVEEGPDRDYIEIVGEGPEKHLSSTRDLTSPNHLDNLQGG